MRGAFRRDDTRGQAIRRAERHLDQRPAGACGRTRSFFKVVAPTGITGCIESDLQIQHKHIQLGVQENRVTKYHDEKLYTTLAVLDFGLTEVQAGVILREGLDLVANRTRYSLRELVGTLFALRRPALRGEENLLARESSVFCSALVQYLFRKAGLDLTPGRERQTYHARRLWPGRRCRTRPICSSVNCRTSGLGKRSPASEAQSEAQSAVGKSETADRRTMKGHGASAIRRAGRSASCVA